MSLRSNTLTNLPINFTFLFIGIISITDIATCGGTICDISQRHRLHPHNVSLIFKDITKFNELQKVLHEISDGAKSIPDKIIYLNKRLLMNHLKQLNLKLQEISSYALRFLDELSEFYHSRQIKISDFLIRQRLEQRWEHLSFSILLEASYPDELGFSLDDIIRCERTYPLVSHTVDVIGERRFQWNQHFINGVKHFIWLRQVIELAGATVAVGPSVSCHQQLNKLVYGCLKTVSYLQSISTGPTDSSPTEFDTQNRFSQGPCYGYCQNVVRGCLAPPLLFLPIHVINTHSAPSPSPSSFHAASLNSASIANLWQLLLSGPDASPGTSYTKNTFDTIWNSLNAADFSELIRQGLETARREISVRKSRFKLLCKDKGVMQRRAVRSVQSTELWNPSQNGAHPAVDDLDIERQQLVQHMQALHDQLTKLARDRMNTTRLIEKAEHRYCQQQQGNVDRGHGEEISCWNGHTFGSYTKPVPAFTLTGQRENPEVILTADDLHTVRATKEQTNEDKKGSEQKADSLQSDVQSQTIDSGVLDSQISDDTSWNQDMSASSGFKPIGPDLEFVPDLRHSSNQSPAVNAETFEQDPPKKLDQPADAMAGCSPDDEDCVVEFEDRNSLKSAESEQHRQNLDVENDSMGLPDMELHSSPTPELEEQAKPEPDGRSNAHSESLSPAAPITGAKGDKKNHASCLIPAFRTMIFAYLFTHYHCLLI